MAVPEAFRYNPSDHSRNPQRVAHYTRAQAIGVWQHNNLANTDTLRAFLSGDREAYSPENAQEVDRLKAANAKFKESAYTPEAMQERFKIRDAYTAAEAKLENPTDIERARARILALDGAIIVTDYDNTITNEKKIRKIRGVKPGHPGAVVADPVLAEFGHKGFADAYTELYSASFQKLAQEFPEDFFENGRTTPLRDGAYELFQALKDSNIPLRIASANLDLAIYGTLSHLPHPDDTEVHSITLDSTNAVHKDAVIVHQALKDKKAPIYMGDGASDIPAMDAADVVPFYIALEGSEFANALKERGLLHFEYQTHYDIKNILTEVGVLKESGVPRSGSMNISDIPRLQELAVVS